MTEWLIYDEATGKPLYTTRADEAPTDLGGTIQLHKKIDLRKFWVYGGKLVPKAQTVDKEAERRKWLRRGNQRALKRMSRLKLADLTALHTVKALEAAMIRTDPAPTAENYPLLALEAQKHGGDLLLAADAILAAVRATTMKVAQIEAVREQMKTTIKGAQTVDEMETAFNSATWPEFED